MTCQAPLMSTYLRQPVAFTRGQGAILFDEAGRRYLDALSGIAVNTLGHAHPDLVAALQDQVAKIMHCSNLFEVPLQDAVARQLVERAGMTNAFFCNSGLEANEAALKLARLHGHARGIAEPRVVVFEHAFHGRSLATLSATANPKVQKGFEPLVPGFPRLPFNDLAALEALARQDSAAPTIAAVLLEPIQGEAGIIVPPAGYLREVRELTRRNNVLLICDEVQTGMGRTGTTFRFQAEDIDPDIITVGKALGAGIVPLSAVIADREILGLLQPGQHGSTFGGNPLACAIGADVCDVLATGEYQRRSTELGERLHAGLETLVGHGVTAVRGAGLWAGVDIDPAIGTAKDVSLDLLDHGILVKDTHGQTLRFAPPLVITEDEIDLIVREFRAVLEQRLARHA